MFDYDSFQFKIIQTIIFSLIFAIGINFFIAPAEILSSGMSGIVQIFEHIFNNLSYSVIYFLCNVPGIILSIIFLGKRFTILSVISIVTVTIATFVMPERQITEDILVNCIFGGLLMGYGAGGMLKHHSSNGGLDIYGMLVYQAFGINFAKFSLIIDVIICLVAAYFFGLEIALFTILSIAVRILTLNFVYRNHAKLTVWIVGENLDTLDEYITIKLKRGSTIFTEAKGGYSRAKKQVIMTTLDQIEYQHLVDNLDKYGKNIFITTTNTSHIHGNYPINLEKK